MGSEVQPLVSIRRLRHEGARYTRDLWSEARAHYRTAWSYLSDVPGFCKKVALTGRGCTLIHGQCARHSPQYATGKGPESSSRGAVCSNVNRTSALFDTEPGG